MNPHVDTFNDELLEHSHSPLLDQSEYFEDGQSVYPFCPTAIMDDALLNELYAAIFEL